MPCICFFSYISSRLEVAKNVTSGWKNLQRRSPEVGWKNLLKLSAFCVHTQSHQVKQEESAMAEQREVIDIIVVIFHIIVQFVVYLMFSMHLLNYQQAGWKTGQESICSRNSRVG